MKKREKTLKKSFISCAKTLVLIQLNSSTQQTSRR
jgi:hypothetical protein